MAANLDRYLAASIPPKARDGDDERANGPVCQAPATGSIGRVWRRDRTSATGLTALRGSLGASAPTAAAADCSMSFVAAIEGLALRRPAPPIATVHRRAADIAERERWPVPSYATVYTIVRAIGSRHGQARARGATSARRRCLRASRP